jgi:hypothetical protein
VRPLPLVVVALGPPLQGPGGQPEERTSHLAPCTSGYRLGDELPDHSSLSGVVSSSSSPQIAWTFFQHQQRGGLSEYLVLALELSLELADPLALDVRGLAFAATPPLQRRQHRLPPLDELRLVDALAPRQRPEFGLRHRGGLDQRPLLLGGPVLGPLRQRRGLKRRARPLTAS